MSVEDSDSDFQSDESNYEAEEKLDDGETDEEEFSYVQMLLLYRNLFCFQGIYNNNALIDMQYTLSQAGSSSSLSNLLSELNLSDDYQDTEDVLSTISSVTSNEAELSYDNGFFLICFGGFIELSDDEVSTSSSSSSSWSSVSDDEEGQSDTDDQWSDAQDEDAEDQL